MRFAYPSPDDPDVQTLEAFFPNAIWFYGEEKRIRKMESIKLQSWIPAVFSAPLLSQ